MSGCHSKGGCDESGRGCELLAGAIIRRELQELLGAARPPCKRELTGLYNWRSSDSHQS